MPLILYGTPPDRYWEPDEENTQEDPLDRLFDDPDDTPEEP